MNLLDEIISLAQNINNNYCPLDFYLSGENNNTITTVNLLDNKDNGKENNTSTISLMPDSTYREIVQTVKDQEGIPLHILVNIQNIIDYLDKNLLELTETKNILTIKQKQENNPNETEIKNYIKDKTTKHNIYHSKAKRIVNGFYKLTNLQELTFDELSFLENYPIICDNCPDLTSLNFPVLTKLFLSDTIVYNCDNLSQINMPSLETIVQCYYNSYNQTSLLFGGCPQVTSLIFPKLNFISLSQSKDAVRLFPSTVTSITLSSPNFCQIYSGRYSHWHDGKFVGTLNLAGVNVYVPKELLAQYQEDERWQKSGAIFQEIK